MSKLSRFLKAEREKHGWSQDDLVAHSGIPKQSISRWENPRVNVQPSHENIMQLADAFGLSPYDILPYIGYPVRTSVNDTNRNERWKELRAELEGDPRAERLFELFRGAEDEEKDAALTILEAHFTSRRQAAERPRRRRRQ